MVAISSPGEEVMTRSQSSATCNFADGRHTVTFADRGTYTGNFIACSPQSGYGTYVTPTGDELGGHFRAEGEGVTLKTDTYQISLWLGKETSI
jgi:hypothetical protein